MSKINWIIILLATIPLTSFGLESKTTDDLSSRLEKHLYPMVTKVDRDSFVKVETVFSKTEADNLPGTPFSFGGEIVVDDSLSAVNVTVFHLDGFFNENEKNEFEALVRSSFSVEEGLFKFSFTKLPSTFKANQYFDQKQLISSLNTVGESKLATSLNRYFDLFLMVIGGGIAGVLFLGFIFQVRLNSRLSKITANLEQISLSSGREMSHNLDHVKAMHQASIGAIGSSDKNIFLELSQDSLMAILFDCYWCEEDQYASYIFSKLNISTIEMLVSRSDFIAEYHEYVSSLVPMDLGYASDPYYLQPLEINKINNDSLTLFLQKYPAAYSRISKMRAKHVKVDAQVKLDIATGKIENIKSDKIDLSKVVNSDRREFSDNSLIELSSVEEEMDLLASSDNDPILARKIPSLYWLSLVNKESVVDELSKYSASDLASAWIGPADLLEELSSLVSDKKMSLVKEYCSKLEPSRKSNCFVNLHKFAIAQLEAENNNIGLEDDINLHSVA